MAHRLPWGSFTFGLQAGLLAHAGQRSSARTLVKTWEALGVAPTSALPQEWRRGDHQPPLTDRQTNPKGSFCIWEKRFKRGKKTPKQQMLKSVVQGDGDGNGTIHRQGAHLFPSWW